MNALERLDAGYAAAQEARYEDALAHYLWFHDHALQEDSALSGVRLSFALADWLTLAREYAPAMDAFRARRDAKVAALKSGQLDAGLFDDVEAMSGRLNEDHITAELFAALNERSPAFARDCAPSALPALVRAKRFDLAKSCMPDPRAHVEQLVQRLLLYIGELEDRPRTKAPQFRVYVHIFAMDLSDVLVVLRATGASCQATRLKESALASLRIKYIRDAVVKCLSEA